MSTLRLVKPSEPAPQEGPARTASPASGVAVDPPGSRDVRVRFDSLPMTMRAVVREQPDNRLMIEAQLPWLAIGTVVHAGSAEAMEHTGRVESFELGVTSAGSACLHIFADVSPAGEPTRPRSETRRRTQKIPRRAPRLLVTLLLVLAAAGGYTVGRGSLTAALFDSAAAEVAP
jgi:hypothetical protein